MGSGILKNSFGFTATELLLVTSIMASVPTGAYVHAKKKAYEISCQNNLRNINMGIQMFVMAQGKLPSATFYPEDATGQGDSIVVVLEQYVGSKEVFVCPSAPEQLKKLGLTYLWNDNLNGRRPETIKEPSKEWLLISMNAISENIPEPHPQGYAALFVNGEVKWLKERPEFTPKK